jgi:hypothetical protein
MKKVLLPLVIASAVFFTACNSKKETTDREMVLLTDSMYKSNLGSDTSATVEQQAPEMAEPQVAAPVVKTRKPAPRKTNTTYNQPVRDNSSTTTAPLPVPQPTALPAPATTGTSGTETAGTGTTTAPEVKKKEGISKAAQGAIIGGVGGAVAGAVLSKKKGTGAVIGGVIGAAGGYILGRKKDRNDGRVGTDTSKN